MTKQIRLRHAFVTAVLAAAVTLVWPQASDAVRDQRFYILTHQRIKPAIETRMQDILLERLPTNTLQRK